MTIDIQAVQEFLATDEGKQLVENHESVTGLRTARDELLGRIETVKNKYKQYDELGDVETLKQALAAAKNASNAPTTTQAPDESNAQLEALRKEVEKERQARDKAYNDFARSQVDATLTNEIAKLKGVPELLKPVMMSRIVSTYNPETGSIETKVMDSNGQPMFVNGDPATVSNLVEEFRGNAIYGRAFESTGSSGSGTRGSDTRAQGGVVTDSNAKDYDIDAHMAWAAKNPGKV